MIDKVFNIITLGMKPIYEKHLGFYQLVHEFRTKLPRSQNSARKLTDKEKLENPFFSGLQHFTVVNLSSQRMSLSESDIDQFYNKLNTYDFSFMFFKRYYKKYIQNLNRFNPNAENSNFDLFMVQKVLGDDRYHPLKAFDVLIHNLKYEVKWSSKIYIWCLKQTKKGDI